MIIRKIRYKSNLIILYEKGRFLKVFLEGVLFVMVK